MVEDILTYLKDNYDEFNPQLSFNTDGSGELKLKYVGVIYFDNLRDLEHKLVYYHEPIKKVLGMVGHVRSNFSYEETKLLYFFIVDLKKEKEYENSSEQVFPNLKFREG